MCKTVSQIKKFTLSLLPRLSRERGDVVLWFCLLFVCVFSEAGMKESAEVTHRGGKRFIRAVVCIATWVHVCLPV